MKTMLIILIILLCLTACSTLPDSATNGTTDFQWIDLDDLPKNYPPDTAKANGDIVSVHGKADNVQRLDEFLENIKAQVDDRVRITQYTIEGDAIVCDLSWDGQQIRMIFDSTRDKFGGSEAQKIDEKVAQKIVIEEREESIAYYAENGDDRWMIFGYISD